MLASVAALGRDGFGLRLVSGLMAAASVPLVALTAEASDKKYVRNIYIYRERERVARARISGEKVSLSTVCWSDAACRTARPCRHTLNVKKISVRTIHPV